MSVTSQQPSVSSKACDACYRSKLKCVGRENPPCERCQQHGIECSTDGRRKSKMTKVEDRVAALEDQIDSIQSQLGPMGSQLTQIGDQMGQLSSVLSNFITHPPSTSTAHVQPQKPASPVSPSASSLVSINRDTPNTNPNPTPNTSIQTNSNPSSRLPIPTSTSLISQLSNTSSSASASASAALDIRKLPPPTTSFWQRKSPPGYSHSHARSLSHEHAVSPILGRRAPMEFPTNSYDYEDIHLRASLGGDPMDDIARHAPLASIVTETEAFRRKKTRQGSNNFGNGSSTGGKNSPEDSTIIASGGGPTKRARIDVAGTAEPRGRAVFYDNLDGNPTIPMSRRPSRELDPIVLGLCTERKAIEFIDNFFSSHHQSLPLLDPEFDQYDSLRHRSSLLFTTVLMVSSNFSGPEEMARKIQEHAESMAKDTLFYSAANPDIESIQALIMFAAWGDNSFRAGGHALRLAIEAGLFRYIPQLVRKQKGGPMIDKEEAQLVVGGRAWLAICKAEYEMAFNHGRPLLIGDDPSVGLARKFLEHPLSRLEDSRLVAACELQAGKQRRHLKFTAEFPGSYRELLEDVEKENQFYETWHRDWISYYDRLGLQDGHFLREILITGKCYAIMFTNCRLLRGETLQIGLKSLSPERATALYKAMNAAATLVHMATNGRGYKDHFLAANSLTHSGIVFAARILVRFLRLLPEAADVSQVLREIQQLSEILRSAPEGHLAEQTLLILQWAKTNLPRQTQAPPPISRSQSNTPGIPSSSSIPFPTPPITGPEQVTRNPKSGGTIPTMQQGQSHPQVQTSTNLNIEHGYPQPQQLLHQNQNNNNYHFELPIFPSPSSQSFTTTANVQIPPVPQQVIELGEESFDPNMWMFVPPLQLVEDVFAGMNFDFGQLSDNSWMETFWDPNGTGVAPVPGQFQSQNQNQN